MNHTGSWVWDVNRAAPVYWSAEMCRIHGRAAAQGPPSIDEYRALHGPEDWLGWITALQKCIQDRADIDCYCRLVLSGGLVKHIRITGHPIVGAAEEVTEILGSTTELNGQGPWDLASQTSEDPVRPVIDLLPALVWTARRDGSLEYCNRVWLDYTGLSAGEALNWGWTAAIHPDDLNRLTVYWQSVLAVGEPGEIEARLRRFDGEYRWYLFRARPQRDDSGTVVKWYGTNTDIEDRKRVEEALREGEHNFRLIVDTIPALVCTMTATGEVERVNRQVLDYFGKTLEELKSWAFIGAVHEDDLDGVIAKWRHSIETGIPYEVEHRIRRADGAFRWFDVRGLPLRDTEDHIIRWYILLTDIEDRKRSEETVRASEARLRLIIDTIPALVWRSTPDGEPDYLNERVVTYTGKGLNDVVAFRWEDLIHPDDLETTTKAWFSSVKSGAPHNVQHRLRRADGSYRWFQVNGAPLRDDKEQIVHWFSLDVDIDDSKRIAEELRLTRARLSRATQFATVAELSASIAHEINQPLAAVVANGHACQTWLSDNPPNVERARLTAERIIRDGNSAAEVVQRIRALFKQAAPAMVLSNINDIVLAVLKLMADELRDGGVSAETDLATSLPMIVLDRVQIQQTLINLAHNAIEAMEGVKERPKTLSLISRRDGVDLVIQVRDSGCGIANPTSIFDPFFTTKENGMGMGLAICRSIVEGHGGRLWATPNESAGTTFNFTLPLHPDVSV